MKALALFHRDAKDVGSNVERAEREMATPRFVGARLFVEGTPSKFKGNQSGGGRNFETRKLGSVTFLGLVSREANGKTTLFYCVPLFRDPPFQNELEKDRAAEADAEVHRHRRLAAL